MASWLLPAQTRVHHGNDDDDENVSILTSGSRILRIILGRCITLPHDIDSDYDDDDVMKLPTRISIITHTGWIVSVLLAILCHYALHYKRSILGIKINLMSPMVVLVAYVTALEGITTDLFGFVPQYFSWQQQQQQTNGYHYLTFFCGNFGILLLNSSWLSIDGGRTALDVLEKMVRGFLSSCCCCRQVLYSLSLSHPLFLFVYAHILNVLSSYISSWKQTT